MQIISQELRAWEKEEYSDLRDPDLVGVHCWRCGERLDEESYSEIAQDIDGMLMWVPVCDNCDPPPPPEPPTPMAARLACPVCSQTLAPPRRHSCGGAPLWAAQAATARTAATLVTVTVITEAI